MAYWSPAVGSLTAPLFNPAGDKIVLRDGPASLDRGDVSRLLMWDIKTRLLRYLPTPAASKPLLFPAVQWSPGGRFISYVKGGNAFGDDQPFLEDYQLNVYDVVRQEERAIAEHPGLNWSWTNAGTLLYSPILPEQFTGVYERRLRPTTYEISAFGKNNKPLLNSGYFAQADPSNQWIAFCDWPGKSIENKKTVEDDIEKGLYLYYRPAKKRVLSAP